MSNYIDSLSDIPKTTRYRNKVYGNPRSFKLRSLANEYVNSNNKKNKSDKKVANFFTVTRTFWIKNGKRWIAHYTVYWRAVYLKRPLKKRLDAVRSGKMSVKQHWW